MIIKHLLTDITLVRVLSLFSTWKRERTQCLWKKLKSSKAEIRDGLMMPKHEHSVLGSTLTTEPKELLTSVHAPNSSLKHLRRPPGTCLLSILSVLGPCELRPSSSCYHRPRGLLKQGLLLWQGLIWDEQVLLILERTDLRTFPQAGFFWNFSAHSEF